MWAQIGLHRTDMRGTILSEGDKNFSISNPIIFAIFYGTYLNRCLILQHNKHVLFLLWKSRGMPRHGDMDMISCTGLKMSFGDFY